VSFDADTALEPIGPGRWRGRLHAHWSVQAGGPHGGFVAALAARAAGLAGADDGERPLRTLAIHYLEGPGPGPVEVAATVERAGRSTSAVSVRIERDERPLALALATLSSWRDGEAEWRDAEMPAAPAPDEAFRLDPARSGWPDFVRNFDMRAAIGRAPRDGPGEGLTGGWLRTAEPALPDAVRVVTYADAWFPAAFARLGGAVGAPTLDLTVHIRTPLPPPGMAPEDFVLGVFRTRWAAGGVWEEDGELWSPDGVLLAQSRQLALVRGSVGAL
jgi:acyl-coenzyme A thioesterase PaaI-like protein